MPLRATRRPLDGLAWPLRLRVQERRPGNGNCRRDDLGLRADRVCYRSGTDRADRHRRLPGGYILGATLPFVDTPSRPPIRARFPNMSTRLSTFPRPVAQGRCCSISPKISPARRSITRPVPGGSSCRATGPPPMEISPSRYGSPPKSLATRGARFSIRGGVSMPMPQRSCASLPPPSASRDTLTLMGLALSRLSSAVARNVGDARHAGCQLRDR